MNRVLLAEEIQHGLDGATKEARTAIQRGLTNEQFHADLFRRIINSHANGGYPFLTESDISAMKRMVNDLK